MVDSELYLRIFLAYLRPAVRTRILDTFFFLLSPGHERTTAEAMNEYHVGIDTGTT